MGTHAHGLDKYAMWAGAAWASMPCGGVLVG